MKWNSLNKPGLKFRNWPIKIKILVSLLMVSLLPIPIIVYLSHNTYKVETYFDNVVSHSFPQLSGLTELKSAAYQIQLLTANFVLQKGESTEIKGSRAANMKFDLLARMNELDKWLNVYVKYNAIQSSQDLNILKQYKNNIALSAMDVIDAYEKNAPKAEINQKKSILSHTQSEFALVISSIINDQIRSLNAQAELLTKEIRHNFITTACFLFLSITVSILISLILAKLISAPIINLYHFALSVKNVDTPAKVNILSMDEIGLLGKSINNMIERLARISESERRAKEQLNLQYSILQTLSHALTLEEGAIGILRSLREKMAYKASVLLVFKEELQDDETPGLSLFREHGHLILNQFLDQTFSGLRCRDGATFVEQLQLQAPPPWKLDALSKPPFIFIRNALPWHIGICCPIIAQEQALYGYIILFQDTEEYDPVLLSNTCNQISTFIQQVIAREKILSLNKAIINSVHQAGMAEMSISVLHNVGNVLNSINVSAELLDTNLQNTEFKDLEAIIGFIKEHEDSLGSFFKNHPKGKHTLHYLTLIQEQWKKDHEAMRKEMHIFKSNIDHIKAVITEYQSINKTNGYIESVNLPETIDDILAIHRNMLKNQSIHLDIRIEINQPLVIYRIKFEQILINLIRNAIDSLTNITGIEKIISIHAYQELDMAVIDISDNGMGINESELKKVFQFGFTTKEYGHGFGLHSSALMASEMGGSLRLQSKGKGLGALATLIIPMNNT